MIFWEYAIPITTIQQIPQIMVFINSNLGGRGMYQKQGILVLYGEFTSNDEELKSTIEKIELMFIKK